MGFKFALAGNQNSGKTTLFNQLTGANAHVGNFPGVTVEKKEGALRRDRSSMLVDLPGIYSLSPYTPEEVVTRDFLIHERPDCIINIVDATNLQRNLYLTLQLCELGLPMVIALNMMDEMRESGRTVDVAALSEALDIAVVPVSAAKNEGMGALYDALVKTARERRTPRKNDYCKGSVHKAIHAISHLVEEKAAALSLPPRFAATKLVEGDEPMEKQLGLFPRELHIIGEIVEEMEREFGTDREAALADMRYSFIEPLCERVVTGGGRDTAAGLRSVQIDRVLTHKVFAIPIFLGLMFGVFALTFGLVGPALSGVLESGIAAMTDMTSALLSRLGVAPWLHSLLIDGAFSGIGSVLSFIPTILTLFFFLSLLEDSGYMARVAFVMDRLLRNIGLSGRSFVPMLIGFGCSVPAIMATRTLPSERDRRMTIFLTPFMSCSAKLPIYTVFTAAFFGARGALVMMSLYLLGIAVAIGAGLVIKQFGVRGKPAPFVMELPAYRLPSPRTIVLHMWEKAKDFLQKAFTIIFLASLLIWFLSRYDFRLAPAPDIADSILGVLGRFLAPIFAPLGFSDWRASTALVTGLTAKEAMLSTFSILLGADGDLSSALSRVFTPLSAYSFLIFTALYMPCVAAVAAVRRELQSGYQAFLFMLVQTGIAYLIAFLFYSFASAIKALI